MKENLKKKCYRNIERKEKLTKKKKCLKKIKN